MKVIKWTAWDDKRNDDLSSKEEIEKYSVAVIKELQNKGYHFGAGYHQNGEHGVPVLDNGIYFQVSQRLWGEIMAKAFPEEFDNPEDPYNYVVWYLDVVEEDKHSYPE